MKINYENVKTISPEAYQELQQYDKDSSPRDGVLDNFELGLLPGLMQQLTKFCVGIVGRDSSSDEFEVVSVWADQCAPAEPAPTKTSNTTPNGKVYPGVIVNIPGGEFEMGSLNGQDNERNSEGKTVKVKISGFKLAKTEVTVGQYKAYLAATGNPSYSKLPLDNNHKGDNYPVVGLTFVEKKQFAT